MKIIISKKYSKIAAKRGTFKYKCDDCGEFTFLAPRDKNRSAIPRCRFCGSTWIDPITEHATERVQEGRGGYVERMELMKEKQNFNNCQ